MRVWVPIGELAPTLADLPGSAAEVVAPDGWPLPRSQDQVEFYVPPFFPARRRDEASRSCRTCGWCRP